LEVAACLKLLFYDFGAPTDGLARDGMFVGFQDSNRIVLTKDWLTGVCQIGISISCSVSQRLLPSAGNKTVWRGSFW